MEGDDDLFAYGHVDEIAITEVSYLALPAQCGCQFFRLATDVERRHVAANTEITARDAVFTLVEDEEHFHFVVGTGCRWRRVR